MIFEASITKCLLRCVEKSDLEVCGTAEYLADLGTKYLPMQHLLPTYLGTYLLRTARLPGRYLGRYLGTSRVGTK